MKTNERDREVVLTVHAVSSENFLKASDVKNIDAELTNRLKTVYSQTHRVTNKQPLSSIIINDTFAILITPTQISGVLFIYNGTIQFASTFAKIVKCLIPCESDRSIYINEDDSEKMGTCRQQLFILLDTSKEDVNYKIPKKHSKSTPTSRETSPRDNVRSVSYPPKLKSATFSPVVVKMQSPREQLLKIFNSVMEWCKLRDHYDEEGVNSLTIYKEGHTQIRVNKKSIITNDEDSETIEALALFLNEQHDFLLPIATEKGNSANLVN